MSDPIVDLVDFSGVAPLAGAPCADSGRYMIMCRPGLIDPGLANVAFPSLAEGDVADLQWPYLRKDAPAHLAAGPARNVRNPYIGVLSIDEATLLHNNALPFTGERATGDRLSLWLVERPIWSRRGSIST